MEVFDKAKQVLCCTGKHNFAASIEHHERNLIEKRRQRAPER